MSKAIKELKPCPFCGEQPEMEWVQHNSVKPDTVLTFCCYISMESQTEDAAIKLWNARADTEESKRLREVVEAAKLYMSPHEERYNNMLEGRLLHTLSKLKDSDDE